MLNAFQVNAKRLYNILFKMFYGKKFGQISAEVDGEYSKKKEEYA